MGVNGHWYIEIEKQGWWRGVNKTFQNRYVMSGAQPTASDALTVIAALKNIENVVFPPVAAALGVGFVAGKAYPDGKGAPFATVGYNPTLAVASSTGFTGPASAYTSLAWLGTLENCLDVRTRLNYLSSSGKPVFTRKLFRGFLHEDEDQNGAPILPHDLDEINAAVAPWTTGMGSNAWVVIGNGGAQAASAPSAQPYVGNHQVPRGKKKKKVSSGVLGILEDTVKLRTVLGIATAAEAAG